MGVFTVPAILLRLSVSLMVLGLVSIVILVVLSCKSAKTQTWNNVNQTKLRRFTTTQSIIP